jgi:aminoglycoside phosphotransferase (APT) family kinase protein
VIADLDVTVDLARNLLQAQQPDLADLPLRVVANGWDNVMMRLGDGLALRLPRREVVAHLVVHEQQSLPVLGPRLPVAVPTPVRSGRPAPALGYPYPWSVVPWFDGEVAAATDAAGRTAWAERLGEVMVALHTPAPADAPVNPFRGIPLAGPLSAFEERLAALTVTADSGGGTAAVDAAPAVDASAVACLREAWLDGAGAARYDGPPLWLHGDPHPGNLVVSVEGTAQRLAAVVDFGDVTSGDPASDLATAWLTFDRDGRAAFRSVVDAGSGWDEATWARARGWAARLATVLLAYPDEHPLMAQVGRHALIQLRDE